MQQLSASSTNVPDTLRLIRDSFAFMDGRVDPPSSAHLLTLETLRQQCIKAEVWVTGDPVIGCMFLTPRAQVLYLGKLAVAQIARGQGIAHALVDHAVYRAAQMKLPAVELQTRIELVENHRTFARMGFVKTGETSHAGYDRVTSITMQRAVA
ncbi:acetyltransferase [Actibacterium mucosum KCTC 23349]|uniref:Acetyltransferase n=1 Tax=Actibacterium mucosum KCTC 23349 TaxID=1454373 RepID=A0A037ZEE0_9RHOB|nr:acetyltransferase [Actibacterium mucosum KCTC 23349]